MLQFLTNPKANYSAAEQAQMMIEGGCSWIEVTAADAGSTLRETLESVTELCRENEAFLMVDSDVELANDFRIHGVHLHKGDMDPRKARELLGPHAVIGVDVESVDEILGLRTADIDYVVLPGYGRGLSLDQVASITTQARLADCSIPIVVRGEIGVDDVTPLLHAGASGLAMSEALTDANDPVAECSKVLSTIDQSLKLS